MDITENATPPYLSVTRAEKLLDLLGSRSFAKLNSSDLTSRGFSSLEASQALQLLRFLQFLDDEGNIRNTQFLALRGQARSDELQKVIINAYSKLFSRIQKPSLLPRDELYNEFIAEYHLSPRLTKGALPLFLWLCKQSGLEVSEDITPRIREKSELKKKISEKPISHKNPTPPANNLQNDLHIYSIAGITLSIPKNDRTDLLIAKGGLAEIAQKIEEFAKLANLSEKTVHEEQNGGVA